MRAYSPALVWLLSVLLGTGFCFHLYFGLESPRQTPPDFYSMTEHQAVSVWGLTRIQQHEMKIGFAEKYPAPIVGMIGNHQAGFFGIDAFTGDRRAAPRYFYNYFLGNLSLPENLDVMVHLEKIGKLPRELIIFQLTTPNNDNGQYIINYNQELPRDLLANANDPSVSPELYYYNPDRMGFAAYWQWRYDTGWRQTVNQALNYSSIFVSLFTQLVHERRFDRRWCAVVDRSRFKGARFAGDGSAIGKHAVTDVERAFAASFCTPEFTWGAFRHDGTWDAEFYTRTKLQLNENTLSEKERFLNPGDENRIAELMRAVDEIGRRNKVRVVFLIPPVYETDRFSSVDEVMSKALAMSPQLLVLDHRHKYREKEYFFNYDHPNELYFRKVVDELKERMLLPGADRVR